MEPDFWVAPVGSWEGLCGERLVWITFEGPNWSGEDDRVYWRGTWHRDGSDVALTGDLEARNMRRLTYHGEMHVYPGTEGRIHDIGPEHWQGGDCWFGVDYRDDR